jgi:hypothetical protein
MLAFFLFTVADPLFNAPCFIVLAHDVSVRLQPREDRDLVNLKLLESHEEIVNVAVFALHDDLCDGPR